LRSVPSSLCDEGLFTACRGVNAHGICAVQENGVKKRGKDERFRENRLVGTQKQWSKAALLLVGIFCFCSSCFLFRGTDRDPSLPANTAQPDNRAANTTTPVPEATLIDSNETAPPGSLVEELRAQMREASFGAARQRHPASKLVGEGCAEIGFSLLEAKANQTKYIGLYRCAMKGSILGISTYDFQVQVIGEIRRENGAYSKNVTSAQASN
jgi:hypothetical protein